METRVETGMYGREIKEMNATHFLTLITTRLLLLLYTQKKSRAPICVCFLFSTYQQIQRIWQLFSVSSSLLYSWSLVVYLFWIVLFCFVLLSLIFFFFFLSVCVCICYLAVFVHSNIVYLFLMDLLYSTYKHEPRKPNIRGKIKIIIQRYFG